MTENQKDVLFSKVSWSGLAPRKLNNMFRVGQVFNDPRIPIIKRYRDNWATEEIAKTIASGRRMEAYQHREATPPAKYAYNAANSAKRNQKAPRGRWDSTLESIVCQGKKAQRLPQVQDAAPASPVPSPQGETDVPATDSHSRLTYTTPGELLTATSPSQIADSSGTECPLISSHC